MPIPDSTLIDMFPVTVRSQYDSIPELSIIAKTIAPYHETAAEFEAQLPRVDIDSMDAYRRVEEFAIQITRIGKLLDQDQNALTGDIKGFVRFVDAQFRDLKQRLDIVLRALKGKMLTWKQEQQRIADEAAALARAEHERLMLEAAEQSAQANRHAEADLILEHAVSAPPPAPAFKGIGTSYSKRWTASVVDPLAVCRAISDGKLPVSLIKEWSASNLNTFAKNLAQEGQVHGLSITHQEDVRVR